jgi:hypothetical protein
VLAAALGAGDRCPSESTIRRTVQDIDADAFDTVIGRFVQQLCTAAWAAGAPVGRRRVLAVDGKTLRGSRRVRMVRRVVTTAQTITEPVRSEQIALEQTNSPAPRPDDNQQETP